MYYRGVDWARTRAYCDGKRSDIWISLRGRQPQGIVESGAEYEALRDQIIQALTGPRDPQTGEPFVRAVYRREEVYHGPYVERSPDLIVDWNRSGSNIDRLVLGNSRGAALRRKIERENLLLALISGSHDRDGLLAVCGPGILPGAEIAGASVLDVAPTVLYLLGQPIPIEMDGRVLSDIIEPELLRRYPVRTTTGTADATETGSGYSEEEARIVGERLRGLGYVE
jgi:predicted AlkP superfamily phosphohydrolase/phosphomutase